MKQIITLETVLKEMKVVEKEMTQASYNRYSKLILAGVGVAFARLTQKLMSDKYFQNELQ